MNTVGKTLVIINLVFALLVGGFLVIDFATRDNWKRGFDKLKAEFDVARANTKTAQDTNVKLLDDKKTLEATLHLLEKKCKVEEGKAVETLDKAKRQADEEAEKAKAAEFNQQKLLSENERLQAEVKDLTATLKKRETAYGDLQASANKLRQEAVANEQKAESANQRALILLEQLRQKELLLARREAMGKEGATTTSGYSPKNPDYRNPPPAYVKGVVQKIDAKDANLAQISIGSDEGVKEGHTLEVYRLTPRPEYVGTMRIVDANHHSALGQLMRPAGLAQRNPLKEGDEVASKIIR